MRQPTTTITNHQASDHAERIVISCCLIDVAVVGQAVVAGISPESFYIPAHGAIWGVIIELYNAGKAIELHILVEELNARGLLAGVGGLPYLLTLTSDAPTTAQSGLFIARVKDLATIRALSAALTAGVELCRQPATTGPDVRQLVESVERSVFAVTQASVSQKNSISGAQAVKNARATIDRIKAGGGGAQPGVVPTGLRDLDTYLRGGLQPAELVVLAGRPSCGKTSLAMNIAEFAAMPENSPGGGGVSGSSSGAYSGRKTRWEGCNTLFFSLEMTADQLGMRILTSHARVSYNAIRDGLATTTDFAKLDRAASEWESRSTMTIDEDDTVTALTIKAKARALHARNPLGLIVVDYLQLIKPTDPTALREQQVAECSRELKSLAKELKIPVLLLAQLNRAAEKENRAPRLSDLRESGAIEQDADVVLMLNRPKEEGDKFQVASGTMELYIAKNRNGEVGDMKLTFAPNITRFSNYVG